MNTITNKNKQNVQDGDRVTVFGKSGRVTHAYYFGADIRLDTGERFYATYESIRKVNDTKSEVKQ